MRWGAERYVKLYTRDSAEWLSVSWQARGLWYELMRKADRSGRIPLGKLTPPKAIAVLIRADAADLEAPLAELLADGCLRLDGDCLLLRNFVEAQETPQTPAARKRKSRESDGMSREVTDGHETSPLARTEETRQEQTDYPKARAARVGVGHPGFEAVEHWRTKVWPRLSDAACPEVSTAQAQSLSVLSQKHSPAVMCAAMDTALADEFWGPKLDLDTFIAKHARWLGRKAPASAKSERGIQPVGQDWNAKLVVE